jgi:hypothetical protein
MNEFDFGIFDKCPVETCRYGEIFPEKWQEMKRYGFEAFTCPQCKGTANWSVPEIEQILAPDHDLKAHET